MSVPSRAYLLSYDNGEDYEDHHVTPLFLVKTKARAQAIVAEAEQWIAAQREDLPPCPRDVQAQREVSDDEYCALLDARSAYIDALKPPHGITDLREAVDPNDASCNGHLTVREIPYLQ